MRSRDHVDLIKSQQQKKKEKKLGKEIWESMQYTND